MKQSRLGQLLALGKELATVDSYDETSASLTGHSHIIVGATNVTVAVVDSNGEVAHVFRGPNIVGSASTIRVVSVNEESPIAEPLRSRRPIHIRSSAEFESRYPKVALVVGPAEDRIFACYPLTYEDNLLGSMFFRFGESSVIDDDVELLMTEIVDMTVRQVARIKASQELEAHARRLEQSNTDLENYAAVVAHDFRAPVRRIRSFTQLLLDEVGQRSASADRHADAITRQVDHLDRLLSDVLRYASALSPTEPTVLVDLGELVDDVVLDLAEALETKQGQIESQPLPIVQGYETLLKQVISNLVMNAVSYTRPGEAPQITISAKTAGVVANIPWWKISVSDKGIGISPEGRQTAFKMFSRIEPSQDVQGTGIGLAFAKRVIELHGGVIGIESEIGFGTEVWFTLAGPAAAFEFVDTT